MVKVDLITGFLGSGKTTFIKRYAQYLLDQGLNIGILENDYGAVNVDMMLLQQLRGENCELEMVAGGCDADCHRRRFKTKLISMGMCGYDRVIIEPSGIFDIDEFFDALYEEPLCNWYEIGNVITIADARLSESLSDHSDYYLASQCANAGSVVLSRTQEASEEEIETTIRHLNQALEKVRCSRVLRTEVRTGDWKDYTEEDWHSLMQCGYRNERYVKLGGDPDDIYSTVYFLNIRIPEERIRTVVENLFEDPSCGTVYRIKGFLRDSQDNWLELNASANTLDIHPIPEGQEVLILIGEGLREEEIRKHFQ